MEDGFVFRTLDPGGISLAINDFTRIVIVTVQRIVADGPVGPAVGTTWFLPLLQTSPRNRAGGNTAQVRGGNSGSHRGRC